MASARTVDREGLFRTQKLGTLPRNEQFNSGRDNDLMHKPYKLVEGSIRVLDCKHVPSCDAVLLSRCATDEPSLAVAHQTTLIAEGSRFTFVLGAFIASSADFAFKLLCRFFFRRQRLQSRRDTDFLLFRDCLQLH